MRLLRKLGIALAILALSTVAFAGTVNLQYNSNSGNNYGGIATYPYNVSVNSTPEFLMCISYNEHVTGGEIWQATTYSVDGYAALIGSTQKAGEFAYLFTLALADGGANSDTNAVAWNINEGVPVLTVSAQTLYNQVTGMTFVTGEFPGIRVYVPTADQTGWTDGVPQTFLGSTPEPSTLLTLGLGILGLAGLARKRFLN
jgi:hypothetical protein